MKDIKELKKIYFNLYKSSDILGEELKGYFYSYIYWILSGIFSNSRYNLEVSIAEFINGFINYSLYIINDKYIIYSPVFYDLESKCFKKVEDKYRIKKEGGFAIVKFTNKTVRKFFNFFMKNIDKYLPASVLPNALYKCSPSTLPFSFRNIRQLPLRTSSTSSKGKRSGLLSLLPASPG